MLKSVLVVLLAGCVFGQNKVAADKEASIKADLAGQIDGMKKQAQVMVDSVFSFGELGMQEFETSKYLSGILEKEGFKVQRETAILGHLGKELQVLAEVAEVMHSLRRIADCRGAVGGW